MRSSAGAVLLEPLDRGRSQLFALARRWDGLTAVLARRDARVALLAACHVLIALPLAVFAPALLLVLGPLVLGVPHLVSDVRHLIVRRRMPSWFRTVVWLGCAELIVLRVCEESRFFGSLAGVEMMGVGLFILLAAIAGSAGASPRRRALTIGAAGATAAALVAAPPLSRLVITHGHNVVAVVLWLVVFRRERRLAALSALLVGAAALLLSSGALAGVTERHGVVDALGLGMAQTGRWLAPGAGPTLALGVVSGFAFLQSVHYAVWLAYIPQEDSGVEGTLTWRRSVRSLRADLGTHGLALLALALVALVAGLLVAGAARTRGLVLSLGSFHGYLELAMLAYFVSRPRIPSS
jgi:hypothetical protein